MSPIRFGESPDVVLGEWVESGKVALCIPDHTRPMDVPAALTAICKKLDKPPLVVVGLGLHRKMTGAELRPLQAWRPIQHDPDDVVVIGSHNGISGSVFRPVMEADVSVVLGLAELHQYAGISSGYKGVVVGCGGRDTIQGLHSRQSILERGVCVGQVNGNPFREFIDAIGQKTNARYALVYVPALKKWAFGEPKRLIQEIAHELEPWQWCEHPVASALVRVPSCKKDSLYQASRAATYLALSPNPPLLEGARIIIEAPLGEGLGSESGFVETMERSTAPWSELLSGPEPRGAGAQRAVMLALMAKKYELVLRGCKDPEYFKSLGFDASSAPAQVTEGTLMVEDVFTQIPQWKQS
jgi:hypothetical protein